MDQEEKILRAAHAKPDAGDAPGEEVSAEDAPAGDAPGEEVSAEDAPAKDSPAGDSPGDMSAGDPDGQIPSHMSHRQHTRRVRMGIIALIVVVAIAVCAAVAYASYGTHRNSGDDLAPLVDSLVQTGDSADSLDELAEKCRTSSLRDLDAQSVEDEYQGMLPTLDDAKQQLLSTRDEIDSMQDDLDDEDDLDVALQAIAFADARTSMLSEGQDIVEETVGALHASELSEQGWDLVLDADALIRTAAEYVADASMENVQSSQETSSEAIEKLDEAVALLSSAQDEYDVDLSAYLEYVNLRIEASQQALASDQAYFDRDKEQMADANDQYNALEVQAADLIKTQEKAPVTSVDQQFHEKVEGSASSYEAQEFLASDSRAFLLDYLGSISK